MTGSEPAAGAELQTLVLAYPSVSNWRDWDPGAAAGKTGGIHTVQYRERDIYAYMYVCSYTCMYINICQHKYLPLMDLHSAQPRCCLCLCEYPVRLPVLICVAGHVDLDVCSVQMCVCVHPLHVPSHVVGWTCGHAAAVASPVLGCQIW